MANAMLEKELQNNVRSCALANGWLFYHTHRSDRSDEGFYDCVMKRLTKVGHRALLEVLNVELKREKKDPTTKQQEWQDVSKCVNGLPLSHGDVTVFMDTFVWYPSDWIDGTITSRLKR